MTENLTGGCLCGAVRFQCTAAPDIVGHCFCDDCRRSSGTSHCTHVMLPADATMLTGELRLFDKPADSGNVVSRGFCPTCGSPVASRNSAMAGMIFVRASCLDDPNAVTPSMTVYASRAPIWSHIDQSGPVFDEMPPQMPEGMAI